MSLDVVFFELRGRRCAMAVTAVSEVVAMPSLTPVPLAPAVVRGVAPLHGQVVPVLDLGVWLMAAGDGGRGDAPLFRPGSDKVLLIESSAGADTTPVRAALVVERVMRLGTIDETHARPPPPGPPFISATVLDGEGPALLIDPDKAIEHTREMIAATVRS